MARSSQAIPAQSFDGAVGADQDGGSFNLLDRLAATDMSLLRAVLGFAGDTRSEHGTPIAGDPQTLGSVAQAAKRYYVAAHDPALGLASGMAVEALTRQADARRTDMADFNPRSAAIPVPNHGYHFGPVSEGVFAERADNNAFSMAANLGTGAAMLLPLADDDEYGTTAWEGATQLHGAPIGPIAHFGDPRFQHQGRHGPDSLSSHEAISQVMAGQMSATPDAQNPVPPEPAISAVSGSYLGATFWAEGDRTQVGGFRDKANSGVAAVWTSRGLNGPKFEGSEGGNGRMSQEHAEALAAAFGRDVYPGPDQQRRRAAFGEDLERGGGSA